MCCFDGSNWRRITDIDDITNNSIVDINIDKKGHVWFAVTNNTVWCYDGNKWHNHSPENVSIQSSDIEILFDSNEDTWITHTSEGILHYQNGSWISNDWLNLYRSYDYTFSPDGKLYSCSQAYDSFMSSYGGFYYPGGLQYYTFDTQTKVVEQKTNLPVELSVLIIFPNPFNPSTAISYTLSKAGYTELVIYSISGQKIRTLVDNYQTPGNHSVIWNGRDDNGRAVSSGIYISQLKFGDSIVTGKMLLIK
ncbi:MAG: T9SS type A sorting domain-containing protein [Candidatus Latescibacteria bacterium]|nr:T9SS type A sorting domain-containing protein [Candidatus Latescibacterota bacterium]